MFVREHLYAVAAERGWRQSSVCQYLRNLNQLGVSLDEPVEAVTLERITEALWLLENVNTRRGAAICARSLFGYKIRIPSPVPRRYVLADENTLRLALMTSPHEIRGLLMMYAGLRLGEACAITHKAVHGDRLHVDRQVQALRVTGKPTVVRITQTKTAEADIVIPHWLSERLQAVHDTAKPDGVRESIRRAGQRVGLSLNPHQLRHWYATNLLEKGAPLALVSRQLRHSDVATTLRHYADHNAERTIHDLLG